MQAQGTLCPICQEEYNQESCLPRILPQCGHTVCSKCLGVLLGRFNSQKCPYDQSPFPPDKKKVEDFKVNFSLKEVLEEESQWELCPEHHERLRLICLTDKVRVCDDCVHFGNHKTHEVKQLKHIQPEIMKKKKKLEAALVNFDARSKKANDVLEKQRDKFAKRINTKFTEMKWMFLQKENELNFRVNAFFKKKKKQISDLLKNNSKYRENLTSNLSKYQDVSKSVEIFNLIEDDLSLISEFDSQVFEAHTKTFEEHLNKWIDSFETTFHEKIFDFAQLELPLQPGHQAISNYIELLGETNPKEESSNEILEIESQLRIKKVDNLLEITTFATKPELLLINPEELKSIEKIRLNVSEVGALGLGEKKKKDKQGIDDDQTLFYIFRNIEKLTSLELIGNSPNVPDALFSNIFPILFWREKDLGSLNLNLETSKVAKSTAEALAFKFLPRLKNLKDFSLNLNSTKIHQQVLTRFFPQIAKLGSSLENFNLSLRDTQINNDILSTLFVPMPNLKSLCLDLTKTRISDESINKLSLNCLPSIQRLESFALIVSGLNITDQSTQKLLENACNLKELALAFSRTQITDATCSYFGKILSLNKDSLQDVTILLDETQATDAGIVSMSVPLENVKEFVLLLDNTKIGDKSLETLASNLVPSMKNLSSLRIGLSKTLISDVGVNKIVQNIPDIQSLSLNLSSTVVSEEFGEVLVRSCLAAKALKHLDIRLLNTKFSFVAMGLINEIKKKLAEKHDV